MQSTFSSVSAGDDHSMAPEEEENQNESVSIFGTHSHKVMCIASSHKVMCITSSHKVMLYIFIQGHALHHHKKVICITLHHHTRSCALHHHNKVMYIVTQGHGHVKKIIINRIVSAYSKPCIIKVVKVRDNN